MGSISILTLLVLLSEALSSSALCSPATCVVSKAATCHEHHRFECFSGPPTIGPLITAVRAGDPESVGAELPGYVTGIAEKVNKGQNRFQDLA
jgi:hypothetical protein